MLKFLQPSQPRLHLPTHLLAQFTSSIPFGQHDVCNPAVPASIDLPVGPESCF